MDEESGGARRRHRTGGEVFLKSRRRSRVLYFLREEVGAFSCEAERRRLVLPLRRCLYLRLLTVHASCVAACASSFSFERFRTVLLSLTTTDRVRVRAVR